VRADESGQVPVETIDLAIVDGEAAALAAAARAVVYGGWLAARLRSDDDERPAETLAREGFEIRDLALAAGETLVLARRPG
jgi:glucose-6-phosphate dehydrogenase assembly protein OpcA